MPRRRSCSRRFRKGERPKRPRQLNAQLEDRVHERTAQLEQVNHDLAQARDQAESAAQAKSEFWPI